MLFVFIQGGIGDGELVAGGKRLRSNGNPQDCALLSRCQMGRALCEQLLSTGYNICSNR